MRADSSQDREAVRVFWRLHIEGWIRSELSQREYCEVHALDRKGFRRWRLQLKYETEVAERKALLRGRGRRMASPMTNPMTKELVPPALVIPRAGRRRNFAEAVKRRIVEETCQPGMSVSAVARRYGIAVSVLFRWRNALGLGPSSEQTTFLPVEISDGNEAAAGPPMPSVQRVAAAPSIIVERPATGIEIELIGGRRVRFERDVDPETVRQLVLALEGCSP